jgi:hypothetical protein
MEKGAFFYRRNRKRKEKKLWQIGHGKKYFAHKEIYDIHTGEKMPCDIGKATLNGG